MIMKMAHQNGVDHDNHFHLGALSVNRSVCMYLHDPNCFTFLRKCLKKFLENSWCTDVALESSEGQVSFMSE